MQCGTHQGNTEQCEQGNVKHKAIHMQMRRRALPSNTVQRKTMQELSEPQEPRKPREPRTGTKQRFRGSRAEGRKCHRPLSREKEGGERNAEGRRTMEKRGHRRKDGWGKTEAGVSGGRTNRGRERRQAGSHSVHQPISAHSSHGSRPPGSATYGTRETQGSHSVTRPISGRPSH